MPLNPRQQAFVREYLVDHNATQAAIRAGYSAKTAHSAGPRLLDNVGVMSEIRTHEEKQGAKLERRTLVTKERISAGLELLVWPPEGTKDEDKPGNNIRRLALMDLAKLHGHIVEKREHRLVKSLDDLSDEELTAVEMDLARKLGDGAQRH